eukprot:gene9656-10644_t
MAESGKVASKEISAALKAAKEAIKQKEYKEALKHCKSVIKIDKTNYHAFVFIGLCAKELEQYEQSQSAFKKAIEQNPEHILAWQGLCNLYESARKEEWNNSLVDALNYLKDFEGTSPEPSEDLLCYWQKILSLLLEEVTQGDFSKDLQDQIENAFQSTMEYNRILGKDLVQPQENHVQFLFECLKNLKSIDDAVTLEQIVVEKANSILESATDNHLALHIICRILLERSDRSLPDDAVKFVEKLNNIEPESNLCRVGFACVEVEQKQFLRALKILKTPEGFSTKEEYIPLKWLLLAKIHLYLHDTVAAMEFIKKGSESISRCVTLMGRVRFGRAFQILKASCMIEQKSYKEALELLNELCNTDPENIDCLCRLGEVYASMNDNANAYEISCKILDIQPSSHQALAIKAMISMNEEKFYDAELRLQEAIELHNDLSHYHHLLGQVCWQLKGDNPDYAKRSYTSLLKAAKLDPYNCEIFIKLGRYYQEYALDLRKAQKCYQKAFALNKFNETAAMALGDVSMDLGDEEASIDVYKAATTNFGTSRVKLAWLRLGMLLTKRGHPDQAVTCFQSALRADPKDRDCWECLGDAYVARGSYTAALKAFSRASEIDPSSVYCKYKIGSIKQALCVYTEAIQEFTTLLREKSDYTPALKGLAECYLKLQLESLANDFNGRAVDYALLVLDTTAKAFELHQNLCCFWKITADACFALHVLPEEKLRLRIPASIANVCGLVPLGEKMADKVDIMDISRRCYAAVVKLDGQSAPAWHDLAISTFHFGTIKSGEEGPRSIQQSIQFAKKAVSLAPHNYEMWNLLGFIAGSSDVANPELSQHAFIKALNIEPQSAEVWTNLGALYLKYNKEAHKAFKKAQDADPSYTAAWIGQASIAELIADVDAMDLFRHSSELGSHTESFLGYAKWVCFAMKEAYTKSTTAGDSRVDSTRVPETFRKAVANSSVCAQKYTERNSRNACAWNLLGVLLEHENLYKQAISSFQRASDLLRCSDDNKCFMNLITSNLARVLRSSGQYTDSIDAYQPLQPLNKMEDISGLALSYFFAGQLEKSLNAYEQALNLCENERDKSDIVTAMAMVGYAMNKFDMTKALLFKSSQTGCPSEQGLMALASFGLLTRDHTLTNAALAEVQKHPKFNTERVQNNFCFLQSAMHLLQGNIVTAKRCIEKAAMRFPHSAKQWTNIAKFLYQRSPSSSLESSGRCAIISSLLNPSSNASMLISAASIGSKSFASSLTNRYRNTSSIRTAQRAVHSYPWQPEAWALLSVATFTYDLKYCDASSLLAITTSRLALQKAEERIGDLQDALKTTLSCQLTPKINVAVNLRIWTVKQLICSYMKCGEFSMALLLAENAMAQYEEQPEVNRELLFLKLVCEISRRISCGDQAGDLLITAADISDGSIWRHQVLASLYLRLGAPLAAELFHSQMRSAELTPDSETTQFSSLARLILISIQCYTKDAKERWLTLAKEALIEISKFDRSCQIVDVLRIAMHHVQGDSKKVKKILTRLETNEDCSFLNEIINTWKKLYDHTDEESVDKDLYDAQNLN